MKNLKGYLYHAEGTDPWQNIADEALILEQMREDEVIFYLWQNARTVVIGRNQNCWRECHVARLEEDGGHLARRLSGGGAVYHDLGNLNFTFLAHAEHYDLAKQVDVLRRALQQMGLAIEQSGRNDLLLDGRKFSGNAFYRSGTRCYHHGTILIDTNTEEMARYLRVSPNKLKSKGVQSTRSRVINLVEKLPGLTVEELTRELEAAVREVYQVDFRPWTFDRGTDRQAARARFASPEWLYDPTSQLEIQVEDRFPWGEVQLEMEVHGERVGAFRVYSDAMAWSWTQGIGQLAGLPYRSGDFLPAFEAYLAQEAELHDDQRAQLLDLAARLFN